MIKRTRGLVFASVFISIALISVSLVSLQAAGADMATAKVVLTDHRLSGVGASTSAYVFVSNHIRPLPFTMWGPPRSGMAGALLVERIDVQLIVNGKPYSATTVTPDMLPDRWDRCVLPGETVAVFYFGWIATSNEPTGNYRIEFTVHGLVQGREVDIPAQADFQVG